MKNDHRINWQMPAEPIGERVVPEQQSTIDPIRAFETMKDENPQPAEFIRTEVELPNFVRWNTRTWCYEAKCCMCGQWGAMLYDLDEIGEEHYCGGSYRCIP